MSTPCPQPSPATVAAAEALRAAEKIRSTALSAWEAGHAVACAALADGPISTTALTAVKAKLEQLLAEVGDAEKTVAAARHDLHTTMLDELNTAMSIEAGQGFSRS